jgi:hypothetical protein
VRRRPKRAASKAVRLYLQDRRAAWTLEKRHPVERQNFADKHVARWESRIAYFRAWGWRIVAVGCEEGAMVVHLRLP